MDQLCGSCGSSAANKHCVCLPQSLLCEWCFALHCRDAPTLNHAPVALQDKQNGARICSLCRNFQGQWICTCKFPWREFCSACAQAHASHSADPHGFEPHEARNFLQSASDLPQYRERQRLVKEFEARVYANLQTLSHCKTTLDNTYTKLKSAVDRWYATTKSRLQDMSSRVTRAMEDALTQLHARQYDRFSRPTNALDSLLLMGCDGAPLFTFVGVADQSAKTLSYLEAGEILDFRENYALLERTESIDTELIQLQELRLS